MFGIGSTELIIIIIVALIVIGPQKLPEMMRAVGKGLAEFKRVGQDVKDTLDREVKQAEQDIKTQQEAVKEAAKKAAMQKAEAVLERPAAEAASGDASNGAPADAPAGESAAEAAPATPEKSGDRA